EDVQHLNPALAEPFTQLLDYLAARRKPVLVSGSVGPAHLEFRGQRFPARLRSRLAGGLVGVLQPLGISSRKVLLAELAQRRQLAVAPEVLDWVATHVMGSGRSLEGAVAALHQLG